MNYSNNKDVYSKKIAIVVGEKSGDVLGAKLLADIRANYPDAYCYGIGGSKMEEYGFHSIVPLEALSVMGIVEVLSCIISLLKLRKRITKHIIADKPDIFIGIDAPEFNFSIAKQVKKTGIKCLHYVSPKIWAWREYRLKNIKQSIDHMLTLFPFEVEYYAKHNIPATFVGHPYAKTVDSYPEQQQAKKDLGIDTKNRVIAIMPGSRNTEINKLTNLFIEVAIKLQAEFTDLVFVIPAANSRIKQKLADILAEYPNINIMVTDGNSGLVLAACTAALVASGTATLETALHQKPMVVSYKLNQLSYLIIKALIKIPYVALPNILSGKFIVPELLQNKATVETLSTAMHKLLSDSHFYNETKIELSKVHKQLTQNVENAAFEVVNKYLTEKTL